MTLAVAWLVLAGPIWALVGSIVLPRRYRAGRLDSRVAGLAGGLAGAALGALGVGWLAIRTPTLRPWPYLVVPSVLLVAELLGLLAQTDPGNPCLASGVYVLNQLQGGLAIGLVYATMAAGLTLVFSVQRIISFAHGQFVMLGGVLAFLVLRGVDVSPLLAIPIVGIVGLVGGVLTAATLLRPVQTGRVERPDEYALLITFGLGMFLTYALVGGLGSAMGIRAPSYTEHPILGLESPVYPVGPFRIRTDFVIAGGIGMVVFAGLLLLLYRTWIGRAFRAVSMDRQAAAVAGIDAGRVFVLAFGIGTMLAAVAGAALVPVFNFQVPDMAAQTGVRSYVIIVLGGLGSIPGALVGGLTLGVGESMTAACYPDPAKGASYQLASGLLVFLAVLLMRPQGLFGRADA